jgi:hypothetical protein
MQSAFACPREVTATTRNVLHEEHLQAANQLKENQGLAVFKAVNKATMAARPDGLRRSRTKLLQNMDRSVASCTRSIEHRQE